MTIGGGSIGTTPIGGEYGQDYYTGLTPTEVILAYHDGTNWHTRNMVVHSARGLTNPEEWRLCGVQSIALDGTIEEHFTGFQRIITLDLGVLQDYFDERFVLNFLSASRKKIYYFDTDSLVGLVDTDGYSNYWEDGAVVGKHYVLRLIDLAVTDVWYWY